MSDDPLIVRADKCLAETAHLHCEHEALLEQVRAALAQMHAIESILDPLIGYRRL